MNMHHYLHLEYCNLGEMRHEEDVVWLGEVECTETKLDERFAAGGFATMAQGLATGLASVALVIAASLQGWLASDTDRPDADPLQAVAVAITMAGQLRG
jgi:hypothetical protein